jgi:hypothetical protein
MVYVLFYNPWQYNIIFCFTEWMAIWWKKFHDMKFLIISLSGKKCFHFMNYHEVSRITFHEMENFIEWMRYKDGRGSGINGA